jgi:hypothetical protein
MNQDGTQQTWNAVGIIKDDNNSSDGMSTNFDNPHWARQNYSAGR